MRYANDLSYATAIQEHEQYSSSTGLAQRLMEENQYLDEEYAIPLAEDVFYYLDLDD